jgi:hypothetical protein
LDYLSTFVSPLVDYFYKFDTSIRITPGTKWEATKNILLHPKIPVSFMPVFGRKTTHRAEINTSSPYGIAVLPFCRYIRYFTQTYQFAVRAQVPWLGFYEADQNSNTQTQYWVQYRNIHTINDDTTLTYPNIGFINPTQNVELIKISSTTTTTSVFYAEPDAKSFVLIYNNFGVLYQEYNICQFGDFKVKECIIIDANINIITETIMIENGNSVTGFYDTGLQKHEIQIDQVAIYRMIFNLNNGDKNTEPWSSFPSSNIQLDDDTFVNTYRDNYIFLSYKMQPKICAPYLLDYELPTITDKIGDIIRLCRFDSKENQYIFLD